MTVQYFDEYLDEQLDKMGSDYFPLPVKLNRFRGLTLGYLRDNTRYFELTQEISEDIQNLFVRKSIKLDKSPNSDSIFYIKEPEDLFRLGSLLPFKLEKPILTETEGQVFDTDQESNTEVKRLSIIKDGQENSFRRDPYKEATPHYPNLTRYSNRYRIDFGKKPGIDYNRSIITYVREPSFGEDLTDELVDLPDVLVERIISKTADALRFSTGDKDGPANLAFNQRFSENSVKTTDK